MGCTTQNIESYLRSIVGSPLQYGIKHSDLNLFQLGFGDCVSFEHWKGQTLEINRYAIHFDSAIHLYWKDGEVDRFEPNAEENMFSSVISKLMGRYVERVALSDKNDLWIDLGICRIVVVTRDDDMESWRFFQPRTSHPHLIASSTTLELEED